MKTRPTALRQHQMLCRGTLSLETESGFDETVRVVLFEIDIWGMLVIFKFPTFL